MASQRYGLWNAPPEVINEISSYIVGQDVLSLWLCGSKRLMYGMAEQGGVTRLLLKVGFMKHLRCWPSIISELKGLHVLALDVGSQSTIRGSAVDAFKTWPRSIRELILSYREAEQIWSTMPNSADLFPNLKILRLAGRGAFGASAMKNLPPTVTTLQLTTNSALTAATLREHLPRHILHLILPCNERFDSSCCTTLPETLQTLHVPGWGVHLNATDIASLPRTITDIKIRLSADNTSAKLKALPNGLKHLKIAIGWNCSIEFGRILPVHLLSLVILDGSTSFKFADLPSTLTKIRIPEMTVEDSDLALLPQGLLSLSLDDPKRITDEGIAALPRGLKKLVIKKKCLLTDECVPLLPTVLRVLWLPQCSLMTGKCFKELPRGIYSLNLASIRQVKDEQIAELPPYLLALNLGSARDLTDAFAKSLSRGLTSLVISDNPNFTFACVPWLPTHISDVNLGHNGVVDKYRIEQKKRAATGR